MGVLFVVFAISMAFATFYENDFGAMAARTLVYDTKWFELLMLLMVVNLIGQIFLIQIIQRRKLTILLFHLAFVLIILGAGITRYFGFEGIVHIREGQEQNICTSTDKYINLRIKDANGEVIIF
ncbi:MAG: cytochrome c biogenesis protein ResB [Marinilabiliales bacterium]|nr:cytochrome c biogenesis protein ResB [Marinilabiliales bacterium]